MLRGLNALGVQQKLLAGVDRLHAANWSSQAQIESLLCQISSDYVELKSYHCETRWLKESLEAFIRRLSTYRAAFMVMESKREQGRTLAHAKVGKRHSLGAILAEVLNCLNDYSSLLLSFQEMFRQDLNWGLHDNLCPLFDIGRKLKATFRSLSSGQVDTQGETLHQSACSVISSLYQPLSSATAVGPTASTASHPLSPSSTSSA